MTIWTNQAFINGSIISLHAPISGRLEMKDIEIGSLLEKGTNVFSVINQQYGETGLFRYYTELMNLISDLENEIKVLNFQMEYDKKEYESLKILQEKGGVAKTDYERLKTQIEILEVSVLGKNKKLEENQFFLKDVEAKVGLSKRNSVNMPEDSVVWAILFKDGEYVDQYKEVMQLASQEKVWIDAFFHEKHIRELTPLRRVSIQVLGAKKKLDGKIVSVRSGVGRVPYDASLIIPYPPSNERLVAVRIRINMKNDFSPAEFFGVGRSVKVSVPFFK